MTRTIGISGAKGSFSEQAAHKYAETAGISDYKLEYLVSVENVLDALDNGSVERGIFPIENSNGGIVIEAVHAMAAHSFTIEQLFEIDVHHCLLALPGTKTGDISAITSHDQALKQCRMYLKRRFPGVELKEYADTAQAAEDLGKGTLPKTTAVIAPVGCAKLYGLDIFEKSIQDLKFNFTSFIAASARS
jgi:prephenate dehydratase